MKYKEEISSLKEEIEKIKTVTQSDDPHWQTITIGGYGGDEKSADLLNEYVGWTYANIVAIAEAVSEIKIQLFELKKGDQIEEIKEHPILELLHRPNQYMTKREFIQLLTIYRLLTGESPIRIKSISAIPSELHTIDPLTLDPIIGRTKDGYEMVVKYEEIDNFNGQINKIELKPEEVIFIKNMNPRNKWRGLGVVEAAQNSIDTLQYSEMYNMNFFKNSAVPFTVLYTDQKLNDTVMGRLKNSWDNNYRGVKNSFKTAVLEAGLKVERLQATSKDMDFIEQQRFLRDKLMAMFKTTKIALGITEDVNRANAEASEYVFMKNCIRPKMAQLVESLNEFLLPIFDPEGKYFLDFEDPVPKDRAVLVNEYSAAHNKWLTTNEIRNLEGFEDVEGGDEIWQVASLMPMTIALDNAENPPEPVAPATNADGTPSNPEEKPEETEDVKPPEEQRMFRVLRAKKKTGSLAVRNKDFSEQIAKLKNRNVRIKAMKEELKNQIRKILRSKIKTQVVKKYEPKYKNMNTKRDTDLYIKTLMNNSDVLENKFNKTMTWDYYQPQMQDIMRNLARKGTKFMLPKSKSLQKQIGDDLMFDQEKYVATGIDLMTPLLKEILLVQGTEALLTLNTDTSYSLLDAARKYLNTMPIKLAKSITETAYVRVRESLADGIKAGESVNELKDRVIAQYKSLEVFQAENIARTEVSRATNFAAVDAFKQSGVVEGKEWVVTPDDRLCEFCQAMESEYNSITGLDEDYFKIGDTVTGVEGGTYKVDFTNISGPPLHNNCRCVLKSVEKMVAKSDKEVEKALDEIERGLDGD